MPKQKLNNQNNLRQARKEGYIIVPNYFLKKWVSILGVGPVVLYQELLTYCHKEKYIAWPSLNSLCQQMGIAKTTLRRYQHTLIKFGLIKKITRGKSPTGHNRNNIYQITPLAELSEDPNPDKMVDLLGSKLKPNRYQNDTSIGSKMKPSLVAKRYPNNSNLNITNSTAANGEKDAVAAVVNFKKLGGKGEEKMKALREQLKNLDFPESFIEKLLQDFELKKIEEKLDLLLQKKNIKSPAGWLIAALKDDYQDPNPYSKVTANFPKTREAIRSSSPSFSGSSSPKQESITPYHRENQSRDTKSRSHTLEPVSPQEALRAIRLIRENLSLSQGNCRGLIHQPRRKEN